MKIYAFFGFALVLLSLAAGKLHWNRAYFISLISNFSLQPTLILSRKQAELVAMVGMFGVAEMLVMEAMVEMANNTSKTE